MTEATPIHSPSDRPVLAAALAALWLTTLAGPPAATQEADPPQVTPGAFGERIEVTLVTVDVWVSDRDGIPVTGLEAEDFQLLHDGRPVPISHFVEVRAGAAVAGEAATSTSPGSPGAAAPTPAPPSHLVVYFDFSRLHPSNLGPLVRGLEELLESEAVEPERVLILRQIRSLSVEAPFGSSRKELRKALERLAAGAPSGMDSDNEIRLAVEAIRTAWNQSQDIEGAAAGGAALVPDIANPTGEAVGGGSPRALVGGVGSGGGPDACGMFVNQIRPTLESWARFQSQRIAVTLGNLSDAAGFLAGLPGVKMLLYLSDGLDVQPGAALATYASGLCPAAGAEILSDARSEEMSHRFLELTRHANTNRVTIHALQATGLRSPAAASAGADSGPGGAGSPRSSAAFDSRRRVADRQGLSLIARETGGRAVFDRNAFGAELVEIGREAGTYYSLAYRLPAEGLDRHSHQIEVSVGDGSLTTRYRRGYRQKRPRRWLTERVEGALNLGITSNPLGVRLGAGAVQAAAEDSVRVPLHVMIPVERLAFEPPEGEAVAEVTLEVLARSLETGAVALHEQSFRVRGSSEATGWADLPVLLELGVGAHVIAVGVQDRGSRAASFVSTTIDAVPEG